MTARQAEWTLRGRLRATFLVLGALITVLAAVVVIFVVRFAAKADDVIKRYQPALTTSQAMLSDLVNQETGVRGFIITRRSSNLQPYGEYRVRERVDTAHVLALVGDDPRLRSLVTAFTTAATTWRSEFADPTIAGARGGRSFGAGSLDAGKALFDQIRVRAAALTGPLRERAAQARAERRSAGYVVVGGLLGSLVVVIAAGLVVRRGLRLWVLAPTGRLAEQTRVVAGGEIHRAIVPDGPGELLALGADVESMRRQIATELTRVEQAAADLERSNSDLQQFAYVASHDLSEPLRKVSNFCQLLERQYGEHLDDRARQYIWFAVDGAKRMQTLINDLLALSRVGRSTESFVPVALDAALDQALRNLAERIAEAGAQVERPSTLPTVAGDRSLLTSLLENLVGNAVKYRRANVAPVVSISVEPEEGGGWRFAVHDNGIGIDVQYAERIFVVFQRLHLRDQYGGTGIGLALCRKIVEFHAGRIWLDPVQSDAGSTFCFTLPEGNPRA